MVVGFRLPEKSIKRMPDRRRMHKIFSDFIAKRFSKHFLFTFKGFDHLSTVLCNGSQGIEILLVTRYGRCSFSCCAARPGLSFLR